MLFYASLFLFCVAISVISLFLFRSLNAVGKAVYRAFLPSSKTNKALRKSAESELVTTYIHTRVPWGWMPGRSIRLAYGETAVVKSATSAAVPWGWPGNKRGVARTKVPAAGPPVIIVPVQETIEPEAGETSARDPDEVHVGWPYRDEAFEFAGRTYRVQQASGPVSERNIGGILRP